MKFYKIIIVAASVFALVACSTSKEISYFQDLRPGESELTLAAPMEIKIQPKDKLSILVNSQDLRLTNLFNLPIVSQQVGQDSSLGTNRGLSGYTVDSKGDIDFPVLGKLHVQDMTREEVAVYIKKELQSHDLIKDPVVTVEFMNLSVNVMGEVNRPGPYMVNARKSWCCVTRTASSVSMALTFVPPTTSIPRRSITCNRMTWCMSNLTTPRHASPRLTAITYAAPHSGFPWHPC